MRPAVDLSVLEAWFERALATPDAERDLLVDRAPRELRDPLARMLASVGPAESALERPRWAALGGGEQTGSMRDGQPRKDLAPGTRVGAFTILELIGRGGMGAVYRAEQDRPRREVAVKFLAGTLVTDRARRRFHREVELLARLDHPGIVPIYEAGVSGEGSTGTPFFAMGLVRGVPLGLRARSEGDRPPTNEQRLELLAKVCDAVEHAHQRGVLHRDLKPANILVDADGRPHVLDFGIARLLSPDESPDAGTLGLDVAGTPAYMSPEQILAGSADTRSDVWALGVIAWEVLTGSYPFGTPPRTFEQAVMVARAARHKPISTVPLGRDARAVLLKAMDQEPDRRYRGAGELGDDLRRVRAGQPVRARPATSAYLLWRWTRRHPVQSGLAMFTLAAMATLAAWAVTSSLDAQRESERRLRAVELAQTRLDAQREFIMRSLVKTAYTLQGLPGAHQAHAELLRDALPRLEALAADAGDDLDLTCDLSDALVDLAQSAGGLGTPNTGEGALAEQLNARALAMAEAAVRMAPGSTRPLRSLERAVWGAASLPSGVPHRRELYARSVALKRQICEMDGHQPRDEFLLAYSLQAYGALVGELGPIEEAVGVYERLLAADPTNWEYQVAGGTAIEALAREHAESDPNLAISLAIRAVSLLAPAHDAVPDNYSCARHLAGASIVHAYALARLGRTPEARASLELALQMLAGSASDPTNTLHVADRATMGANAMETVHAALDTPGLAAEERSALIELGLRAYALVRFAPSTGDTPTPDVLAPVYQRVDELAQTWRAELDGATRP